MDKTNDKKVDIGLEVALTASIYRASGIKLLKSHGLKDITIEQFGILLLLSLGDGLYQTQIANILGKDRPNITRMIDILETKGFIRPEKDATNRRILKVYITEKGQKKAEIVAPLKERMETVQMQNVTFEEVEQMITTLRKIRNNIQKEYKLDE